MNEKGPDGLICVYGPTDSRDRATFFQFVVQFISLWGCNNFSTFGDFNVVLYLEERLGINRYGAALEEFISFVDSVELQDLPLVGSKFTFFKVDQAVPRANWIYFLLETLVQGGLKG